MPTLRVMEIQVAGPVLPPFNLIATHGRWVENDVEFDTMDGELDASDPRRICCTNWRYPDPGTHR
jgi:hypothetical protein